MNRIFSGKRLAALAALAVVLCLLMMETNYGFMSVRAGRFSDDLEWTVENGVLTISGEGKMKEQGIMNREYRWREPDVHTAIIQEGVTTIGDSSFEGCDNLKNVQIASTVYLIDDDAFKECTGLEQITIPDSVTEMGDWVFARCDGLKTVTIPSSVTEIGSGVFYCCEGIESAAVEQSAPVLEESTFDGCISLKSVTIGNSVTEIGPCAFEDCVSLESITLPSSVKVIQHHAFFESGLKSIYFDSVERIDYGAFQDCVNLTDVYYGGSKAEWEKIEIEEMANEYLLNATIHFNSNTPREDSSINIKAAAVIGITTMLLAVTAVSVAKGRAAKAAAGHSAGYSQKRLPAAARGMIFIAYLALGSVLIYYLVSLLN